MSPPTQSKGVKEGDWVRIKPLWPGVWRIARVVSGFRENRWSLDSPVKMSSRTIVLCHRALNDSWERSFSFQSCELSLVESLSEGEREQVAALFADDEKLQDAFAKYQQSHNSMDMVANLSLGALADPVVENFVSLCDEMLLSRIADGVTLDEVLQLLRDRDLEKHLRMIPKQRTVQMVCTNYELRGGEFLYRRYRILNH